MDQAGEKQAYPFDAAELDFATGMYSMNALANRHGIPEATLRRYAKKHGWVKGSAETKRELVADALAGGDVDEEVTNKLTNDEVRQRQMKEAAQDVADMNKGLQVARKVMDKLLTMVDSCDSSADIKRIVEANQAAVLTIRKIRSLDNEAPPPPETTVNVTVDEGFAELRAAFRKRLAAMGQTPTGTDADTA